MEQQVSNTICEGFSGPVLFAYVWWIMRQAHNKGIKRLYFLARDGYVLQRIAQQFCEKFSLPIECRYLYCSRASLRMPTYNIIGEEAYDLLLSDGYYVTLFSLLKRVGLNREERNAVYRDCGLENVDEGYPLNRFELKKVRKLLKNCDLYGTHIREKSLAAYDNTIGYLRQEGLLEQDNISIVDSGWVGSMQRSLRQLLESAGFRGSITGFYFGLYNKQKEKSDGTHLTWYFNHTGKTLDKIPFCNNMFELLLSAPHGMTEGYTFEGDRYVPLLLQQPNECDISIIENLIGDLLKYTESRLENTHFVEFNGDDLKNETRRLIRRYMAHPTREEATYFGRFLFCDDVSEAYHFMLAEASQIDVLKSYSIPIRVLQRVSKINSKKTPVKLFWPYGTITFLPRIKQIWYRWNIYIWEWFRYELR